MVMILCWQPSLQKGFKVSSYYSVLSRIGDCSSGKVFGSRKFHQRFFFFFLGCLLGDNTKSIELAQTEHYSD